MNSSGSTTTSAPLLAACARAMRTLSALTAMSPMVGLSCASVIVKRAGSVIGRYQAPGCSWTHNCCALASAATHPSNHAHALAEREQPDHAGDQQGHADGGRAEILDAAD